MLQNALPAAGLLLAMMVVAWLLQRWRRHLPGRARQNGPALKIMNTLSLGPQQRVVTVQVGDGADGVCLVLGVAPGGVTALHQIALPPDSASSSASLSTLGDGDFKQRLQTLIRPQPETPHAPG